jgi:hypothetical protein
MEGEDRDEQRQLLQELQNAIPIDDWKQLRKFFRNSFLQEEVLKGLRARLPSLLAEKRKVDAEVSANRALLATLQLALDEKEKHVSALREIVRTRQLQRTEFQQIQQLWSDTIEAREAARECQLTELRQRSAANEMEEISL